MSKVLVLYYSSYGHIERMAEAEAEGARAAGAHVDVGKARSCRAANGTAGSSKSSTTRPPRGLDADRRRAGRTLAADHLTHLRNAQGQSLHRQRMQAPRRASSDRSAVRRLSRQRRRKKVRQAGGWCYTVSHRGHCAMIRKTVDVDRGEAVREFLAQDDLRGATGRTLQVALD